MSSTRASRVRLAANVNVIAATRALVCGSMHAAHALPILIVCAQSPYRGPLNASGVEHDIDNGGLSKDCIVVCFDMCVLGRVCGAHDNLAYRCATLQRGDRFRQVLKGEGRHLRRLPIHACKHVVLWFAHKGKAYMRTARAHLPYYTVP